jgi:probable phosphomutase (TIGR03848 family)
VTTLLLVRHGRTAANAGGVLAGWSDGVDLDDRGREQAQALSERLSEVAVSAIVTSPLDRCRQTAEALAMSRPETPVHLDDRVGEVHYGDWTGQPLKALAKQPLWKTVQAHPSAVVFPGEHGEAMAAMQGRVLAAVREWNATLGDDAVYLMVSHADVIKAVLADALGQHLDQFQRIVVDPASLSVVRYEPTRAFVERMNDTGGGVSGLKAKKRRRSRKRSQDAVVGGGAGE